MTDYTTEVEVTLSNPIKFANGGDQDSTYNVTLVAPSNRNRIECAKIKQMFFRAIADMEQKLSGKQDTGKKVDDSAITGKQALSLMLMSEKVDYCELQDAFFRIITNGGCKLTDNITLKTTHYDEMMDSDTEELLTVYIENFFMPSLMKMIGEK